MDALGSLLAGPRAHDAFLLRVVLDPPWSLRVRDSAPLTLIAVTHGEAWLVPDDPGTGEPARLGPGDVAVVRGPEPYTVACDPAVAPRVVVEPGRRSATPTGGELCADLDRGVRTWGTGTDGSPAGTTMLVGTYEIRGAVSGRLLTALPTRLVVPGDPGRVGSLLTVLGTEIGYDEPGQDVVLDRLLDLLLITVLRAWFARPGARPPGWYSALGDPLVGRALRLLHDDPARAWTVGALAKATGFSRATLARRFTELVGEPPMTYLAGWRLDLAADLLREPGHTLDVVARKVGYGNAFALSTAFKRVHGVSPRQYRSGNADRRPRPTHP